MAAFRRRTHFATPVILVVAGCSGKATEKRFPGVTYEVRMVDMKCRATEPGRNPPPPRAIECPPGMSGSTTFVVGELANGTCGIVPRGCTDEACVKIKTPCPLPYGREVVQKLANVWTIEKRGERCHAEEGGEDECPPGVDCNPPQPRFVPCPPGITEDKVVRIAELPDATCAIVPPGCKTTDCATEKIECP